MEKNRTIKFRGYCEDIHQWVYGSFVHIQKEFFTNKYNYSKYDFQIQKINAYIIVDKEGKEFTINDKETIGQFTGLKDKNGVEIYEGDIYIQGDKNITYTVVWKDTGLIGKQNCSTSYAGLDYWKDRIEIIGNKYNNPELLKEE